MPSRSPTRRRLSPTGCVGGAPTLADVLRTIDLDGPTWHPFAVAKTGWVWPRRQAQETSVHRWDAEHAIGATTPIDPELASDGIDEYLDLMLRRCVTRERSTLPVGSLHLHCTDTDGEWLMSLDRRLELVHVPTPRRAAALLRGPAEALLLRLVGRRPTGSRLAS